MAKKDRTGVRSKRLVQNIQRQIVNCMQGYISMGMKKKQLT